jgi:hypothetical protein
VDLLVRARVSGFVHMLVVRSRAAAANPALRTVRYGLTGKGLSLRQRPDGTLAGVDDTDAALVTSGPAVMWDSAAAARADAGSSHTAMTGAHRLAVETPDGVRGRHVGMRLAGGQLEITPSRQLLEDPATVFPVLIDPFFSTSNWPWAYADQSMRMDLQEFRRNLLVNPRFSSSRTGWSELLTGPAMLGTSASGASRWRSRPDPGLWGAPRPGARGALPSSGRST